VAGISVVELGPGRFGVQVREGTVTTNHEVAVSDRFVDDLGLSAFARGDIVHEAMAFLLEREPATAILGEFPLEQIAVFFPDFFDELRARLGV
jgi:hypothetical protein